jgi:predicted site-specific integrase-resolvase
MPSTHRNKITTGEPLIDTDALAQHVGVSPRTVRAWVLKRKIPCYHISTKCLRFKLSEVLSNLEQRKVNAVNL